MISVTKIEVPEYLHNSQLFRNLATEDDGVFEIPASTFKADVLWANASDLAHLLASLRYWVIDTAPIEMLEQILELSGEEEHLLSILNEYKQDIHGLDQYLRVRFGERGMLTEAICAGQLNVLECVARRLESDGSAIEWTTDLFCRAFTAGNVACLEFLVTKGCRPYIPSRLHAPNADCLAFALDRCTNYEPDFTEYCKRGKVGIVELLLQRKHEWGSCDMETSAARGHFNIIRLLHEQTPDHQHWGCVTGLAASCGYQEILQYAYEHGAAWSPDTLLRAANGGHWPCLQYALEQGSPYHAHVAAVVAGKSLPMLQYLRQRGCDWDLQACMERAVSSGDCGLIEYVRSQGASWPRYALQSIARRHSVEALQYAYDHGLPFDAADAFTAAVSDATGHRVRFLHEHGCPWDYRATRAAARLGHLTCLQYLVEHGCPVLPPGYPVKPHSYQKHPTYEAAMSNQLPCLRYLLGRDHSLRLTADQLRNIPHEDSRIITYVGGFSR